MHCRWPIADSAWRRLAPRLRDPAWREEPAGALTVAAALRLVRDQLGAAAVFEAFDLVEQATACSRRHLLAHPAEALAPAAVARLGGLVARRRAGEPLAYVLGRAAFLDFEVAVDARVLVPRPETEALALWALERAKIKGPGCRLLDVGTGSGVIALAVARGANAEVTAVDVSADALAVARQNAVRLGLDGKIDFVEADLWPPAGEFDVVVANLPYVGARDQRWVEPSVRREPPVAVFAGADGLLQIRRLARGVEQRLHPGGDLGLEIAASQADAVAPLVRQALPAAAIRVEADYTGRPRFVLAEGRGRSAST